jgi:hypothetical protein
MTLSKRRQDIHGFQSLDSEKIGAKFGRIEERGEDVAPGIWAGTVSPLIMVTRRRHKPSRFAAFSSVFGSRIVIS